MHIAHSKYRYLTLVIFIVRRYCLTVKTVTVREFYHNARLVDGLAEGKQLVVTANGKPRFIVIKSRRPRMTRKLAEARSVGNSNAPKFDGVRFLTSLKK